MVDNFRGFFRAIFGIPVFLLAAIVGAFEWGWHYGRKFTNLR